MAVVSIVVSADGGIRETFRDPSGTKQRLSQVRRVFRHFGCSWHDGRRVHCSRTHLAGTRFQTTVAVFQPLAALRHSIAMGRTGKMPAFGERLDETQIRLLVALLSRNSSQE